MKQQYESYKSSGIDWIGEIPSHWDIVPIKQLKDSSENAFVDGPFGSNLKSQHYVEDGDVYVVESGFITTGKFVFKKFKTITLSHFETIKRSECKQGDIIIAKIGYNFGMVAELPYLDRRSVVSGNSLKITLNKNKILSPIFVFLMNLAKGRNAYVGMVQETAQPALSLGSLNQFKLPLPPLAEQEAIATWLDEKCGEIDAAIVKVDREIELIDELKQSEISRVVTRGLNPNAPLRPSGIDWICDIPEHWEIRKTSHLFSGIGSGTTPTSGDNRYYSDEGISWLQTGDLNDGVITETSKKITNAALKDFSSLRTYPIGSIVIAMYGATIGKLGKLKIQTTTNQACCVLPKSSEILQDFAFYSYLAGKKSLINSAYGGGQPNISQDTIKSFRIALPPLSEQHEIADYLDKKCAEIDGLKAKLKKKREALVELRQSLISEVVTGKRRVV